MARVRDAASWDAGQYARDSRFVSDLGESLIALLAPAAESAFSIWAAGTVALSAKLAARGLLGCRHRFERINGRRRPRPGVSTAGSPTPPHCPSARSSTGFSRTPRCTGYLAPDTVLAAVARALKPGGEIRRRIRRGRQRRARLSAPCGRRWPAAAPISMSCLPLVLSLSRGIPRAIGTGPASALPQSTYLRGRRLCRAISPLGSRFSRAPFIEAPDGGADAMYDELRERLRPELWDGEK